MTSDKQQASILIITGTVGVGKTSVGDEMFEILQSRSESVALINIDELGYVSPRPADDPYNKVIRLKNLAAVWRNYADLGTKLAIIPTVVETIDELEAYKKAIPDARFFIVRLDASSKILEDRIKNRSLGGDEAWHLKRATELTEILENNQIEDMTVATDGKTISVIASEVLAKWQVSGAR